MEELISIIVPIYNCERYIKRCVDSIIDQTYRNIEIILVDDGSKDESGKICDEYAKTDKRVKVIHKEYGGVSDARNVGVCAVNGKYIAFVDSDDYVSNDYIEYMHKLIKENNSDMSICGMKVINKLCIIKKNKKYKYKNLNKKETFELLLYGNKIKIPSICAILYPRNFFEDIIFPIGEKYEDVAVIAKLIDKADKITLGEKECYFYCTRSGSLSRTKMFDKAELDYINNTKKMLDYIQFNIDDLDKAISRYKLYSKLRSLRILLFSKQKNDDIQKELIKDIKILSKEVYKDYKAPIRDKIAIILLRIDIKVFKISWYIYSKFTGRII